MPSGKVEPSCDFPAGFSKMQQTHEKKLFKQGRQQVDLGTARFQIEINHNNITCA